MFHPASQLVIGTLENLQSQVVQLQFNDALSYAAIKVEDGSEGNLR